MSIDYKKREDRLKECVNSIREKLKEKEGIELDCNCLDYREVTVNINIYNEVGIIHTFKPFSEDNDYVVWNEDEFEQKEDEYILTNKGSIDLLNVCLNWVDNECIYGLEANKDANWNRWFRDEDLKKVELYVYDEDNVEFSIIIEEI